MCPFQEVYDVRISSIFILPATSHRLKVRSFRLIFVMPLRAGLTITFPVSVRIKRRFKKFSPRDSLTICVFFSLNFIPNSAQRRRISCRQCCRCSYLVKVSVSRLFLPLAQQAFHFPALIPRLMPFFAVHLTYYPVQPVYRRGVPIARSTDH